MTHRFKAALAASSAALVVGLSAPLSAETLEETAARFGIRQTILQISLSPAGSKIAFIAPGPQASEVLNVIDLGGEGAVKTILSNTEQNADLSKCDWATEARLVCRIDGVAESSGTLIGYSRLFAIGADGTDALMLTPRLNMRSMGRRQDGGSVSLSTCRARKTAS